LIAAGLRAGGIVTCAKTTGTLPRFILPDGSEEPIYRVGPPSVAEQFEVARRARRLGARALVVECMALDPELQWVSTSELVRPTHGVITNVRADHLDVMGPTTADVALALCGSVPLSGALFAPRGEHDDAFDRAARDRSSRRLPVDAVPVGEAELAGFGYIEHADNVRLALSVCSELGVAREVALRGMQGARPDPGALTMRPALLAGHHVSFVNGFAANDPESSELVWELALSRAAAGSQPIALINCRRDRPERSQQLGKAVPRWTRAALYVVVGSGTHFFTSAAERGGLERARLRVVESEEASAVLSCLGEVAGEGALVVGMGNIGGVGLELLTRLATAEALA
jgi:poly-gamma-glutamate synthase PgsB/CapB